MRQSLRRKSCSACVRAKRRCGLQLPRCSRCTAQSNQCLYPDFSAVAPPSSSTLSVVPSICTPVIDDVFSFSIPMTIPFSQDIEFPQSCGMQLNTNPIEPPAGTLEDLTARAEFCAHLMSLQSASLAGNGFNAFIHPSQTLASHALRDALSGCALHAVRNTSNARLVDAEVARRASQVVGTMHLASMGGYINEMDLLPSVQALLVYQCIRLFSPGSLSQQMQAERDNIELQSWATRLQVLLSPINGSELANTTWEAWVKQESLRRTLVCIELIQGTYTFLRGLWPMGVRCHHNLEFDAQKSLWEAKSAAEWQLVCEDPIYPSLPCNLLHLDEDIQQASPSELDDIGVLLRVAGKGFENLNAWLGRDRQALQRWGDVRLR